MSNTSTIARPYAKAVFEHAVSVQQLSEWSQYLQSLAQAVFEPQTKQFIENPSTTPTMHVELLLAIFSKVNTSVALDAMQSFISLLAQNKRLLALPDISAQYEMLRAQHEKTLEVQVTSFSELTESQQNNLINSLSQRMQRQITVKVTIDKSLLGGAVIRAGDLVIDGSVKGKLNNLRAAIV